MAYKIEVDAKKCIGCGTCVGIADGFFKMTDKDGKEVAVPKKSKIDKMDDAVQSAKDSCPVGAIKVSEV